MELWIASLNEVTNFFLRYPGNAFEWWVLVGSGFAAMVVVFTAVQWVLSVPNMGLTYSLLLVPVGVLVCLLAVAAAAQYMPEWDEPSLRVPIAGGAIVAVSALLLVPVMCRVQRGDYLPVFLSWVISIGALIGVIVLMNVWFEAITSGSVEAEKGKVRKIEIEEFFRRNP